MNRSRNDLVEKRTMKGNDGLADLRDDGLQEGNENVCWPLAGSGEIDILEHFGSSGANKFSGRGVKATGGCDAGDWSTYQVNFTSDLSAMHEYQMEIQGADLIYRIDNVEKPRSSGIGGNYAEPFFMILNYALQANMASGIKEYAMEVDWVKHESSSSGTTTGAGGASGTGGTDGSSGGSGTGGSTSGRRH